MLSLFNESNQINLELKTSIGNESSKFNDMVSARIYSWWCWQIYWDTPRSQSMGDGFVHCNCVCAFKIILECIDLGQLPSRNLVNSVGAILFLDALFSSTGLTADESKANYCQWIRFYPPSNHTARMRGWSCRKYVLHSCGWLYLDFEHFSSHYLAWCDISVAADHWSWICGGPHVYSSTYWGCSR